MAGWNGSGVFSKTHSWVQDKLNGIKVRADRHDANDVDFVNGINNCITKDGQNSATADLPMDGNKHTGVGNAAAADEYATLGQLVNNASKYYTTGGAADAYTITPSPAITAYTAGQQFYVKISATNTTASTINVNALGVKSIVKDVSTALVAGDLEQNRVYSIIYDGTNFQVQPTGSLAWQDANAVAITGGTITGGTIDGVTLGTNSPVTEAQIDNININGSTISSTDTDGDVIISPNGTGDIDASTSTIKNVVDPSNNQDAATKNYVDITGGRKLIHTTTLSNTATWNPVSVITSAYKQYVIEIINIVPATDGVYLNFRTGTNNSSLDSGASDYAWAVTGRDTGGITIGAESASDTEIVLNANRPLGSDAGESSSYTINLYDPSDSALFTNIQWDAVVRGSTASVASLGGAGSRLSAADVDIVGVVMSSGNMESGTIKVYGVL